MSAETAPKDPVTQPENGGHNPSDFRTPLPYETSSGYGNPTEPAAATEETASTPPPTPAEAMPIPVVDADAQVDGPSPAEEPAVGPDRAGETLPPDRHAEYERYANGVRAAGVVVVPSYETWQKVHHPEDTPATEPTTEPEPAREVVVPLGGSEAVTPPVALEAAKPLPIAAGTAVAPKEAADTTAETGAKPEPPVPEPGPTPVEPAPTPPSGEVSPPPPGGGEDLTTDVDAPADMAPERRRGFRALPERSRNVLRRMYDRVAAEPELRRVIGKMEIAYHQIFLDRHQERSVELKGNLDIFDARLEGMDQARADIEADVTQMERDGEPGSEALKMSLQKLDRSRAKIMAERDKVQTDFEAVDNKARLRATRRDAVADRLIDAYDRELLPLESELEISQAARDEVELTVIVTEVKHKELRLRAEKIQERKERIADAMHRGRSNEKDIRKVMSSYDIQIGDIAEQISRDEQAIAARKLEIDARVAKVAAAADPYRDKREEFVRIKNSRPIDIEVATRTREAVTGEETPTSGRTREFAESGGGAETTTAPEVDKDPRPEVSSYVSQWNEHLAAKGIDEAKPVDLSEFTKVVGIGEAKPLDPGDFKKLLAAYLKRKKVPPKQYADALGDFLAGA